MNVFGAKNKEKTILDLFTYDLTTFFYDDYEEVDSEETPATIMIVYQKGLPWKELEIFDAVQFRIFFDKESITGSNPVNVKFVSEEKSASVDDLKNIVDKIIDLYGEDDYRKGEWDNEDEKAFIDKNFRRVWTIEKGESFVSVEFSEENGITLSILFFNNLIKQSEKFFDIRH